MDISGFLNMMQFGFPAEVQAIRQMAEDAARYRWLNEHTADLFMVTEETLDAQIDAARSGHEA